MKTTWQSRRLTSCHQSSDLSHEVSHQTGSLRRRSVSSSIESLSLPPVRTWGEPQEFNQTQIAPFVRTAVGSLFDDLFAIAHSSLRSKVLAFIDPADVEPSDSSCEQHSLRETQLLSSFPLSLVLPV